MKLKMAFFLQMLKRKFHDGLEGGVSDNNLLG